METEMSPAERYYQNQLKRMKTYYDKNKDSIAEKRRAKRVAENPEIKARGKFNKKEEEIKE
jgi:hypothetical protein